MRRFPVLLSLLFLLTGCAASAPQLTQTELSDSDALIWALYDPDSQWEAATEGAVYCYPLSGIDCTGLLPCTEGMVLFTVSGSTTTLAMLDPATGCADAFLELPFPLSGQETSVRSLSSGLSCFDPIARQTLILDGSLKIILQIPEPEGMIGEPILSSDQRTLYYCTESSIRALDLSTGISRILKESAYSGQQVWDLLMNDSVLVCHLSPEATGKMLFLSSQTGASLGISDSIRKTGSTDNLFMGLLQERNVSCLVFGTPETPLESLILPDYHEKQYILPQNHAALTTTHKADGTIVLHHYDLLSGKQTGILNLPEDSSPRNFTSRADGTVWFIAFDSQKDCDSLFCWNPSLTPANDGKMYTYPYYSRQEPDQTGINQCTEYAAELSKKYGIEILIYKDASSLQPGDYKLDYEHLTPVLFHELQQLEQNLSHYPAEMLQTLIGRFDGVSICILRSITSVTDGEAADGITFRDGHHPYIALAAGTDTEKALYHQLCHLIDTIVINESSIYDTWNQLNPTGFEYDYDYFANRSRNSTAFLLDTNRYFVDMYSMSFPKEDRARIMEYAMTSGNEKLFQGDAMQNKLQTLCTGIRKAFHLTSSTETYLWEQYLHFPLDDK